MLKFLKGRVRHRYIKLKIWRKIWVLSKINVHAFCSIKRDLSDGNKFSQHNHVDLFLPKHVFSVKSPLKMAKTHDAAIEKI